MSKKYHAHRVDTMTYEYRGFIIEGFYYSPEGRNVWEAVDHDGSCFAQSFTLAECKMWIDEELDK